MDSACPVPYPNSVLSHFVYFRVSGPFPKCLSVVPEDNSAETPQCDQRHVSHDWRNITTLLNPRSDELGKSIAPNVFVDSYGNKD